MIRTKDGHERLWSFVTSALGTHSDGRHVLISVAQDVTERRAQEEQIDLLMREANHRIKNILGLVQAIARQTAAYQPEDFVSRFTERIEALAASQDLLVRNKWQGIDVEDLARAQLAHFADLIGPRITVEGPALRLNAGAAQAIGLALHELATNAGKFGALSSDVGRVDIGWGTDGNNFTMSWTEGDGPAVSAPQRRGFGTTVMEAMAARSVDGTVELDYAPSGVTWRLTCPAANALETPGQAIAKVLGIGWASVHRVLEGGWHRADERRWRIRLGGALCYRLPEEGHRPRGTMVPGSTMVFMRKVLRGTRQQVLVRKWPKAADLRRAAKPSAI